MSGWIKVLTPPSPYYMSFHTSICPVNHLHWYWQSNQNNEDWRYAYFFTAGKKQQCTGKSENILQSTIQWDQM